jgi:hypothetical protein
VQGRLQVGYLGAGTCTITTNPTVNNSIVVDAGGTLTQNVASTATAPKMLATQNGTVVYGTGTHTLPAVTFQDITVNTASATTAGGAITVNGTLNITSGSTLNMATFLLTAGPGFAVTGTGSLFTQNTTATAIPAGISWPFTVGYRSTSGGQTIVDGTYSNLTVGSTTGTITYTVANPLTITGTLNFGNANSTLADGGFTVTVGGSITGTGKHSGTGKILLTGSLLSGMTASGNLELSNPSGVSLTGNLTVNKLLTFTSGKLSIDTRTLTFAAGSSVTGMDGVTNMITGGLSAGITITATSGIGTLFFDQSGFWANNVANFTLSGNGGQVTLGNNMSVSTLLSITGNASTLLEHGSNTVDVSGNISATNGKTAGSGKIRMIGLTGTIQATTGGLFNVELDNAAGFTLSGNTVITGTLTFTNGKLSLNGKTFTLKGVVAGMSAANAFTGSAASNMTINTSGSTGDLYFDQGTPGTTDNIATFTNTTGTTVLGSNMSVSTALTLTAGTFNDNGNTVNVSGNVTSTSCTHTGSGKISMTGVGKTISATPLGLNNVEINSAAGISLAANTVINGNLGFAAGNLSILARTLTLKGTVSGMSAAAALTGNGVSSVLTINSTGHLGTLFFDPSSPGVTNHIATFTMNSPGFSATLGNDVTVGTALALTAGELNDGGNTINLLGNITGTGSATGAGKILMTSNTNNSISGATLTNLELDNTLLAFTLTGNTTINGTLTFSTGSITIGARTLTLNGSVVNMNATSNYFRGSTTSNLVVGAAGSFGPIYFVQSTPLTTNNLLSLVVNGGGNVIMGNDMSINNLTLTSGNLSINDNLLTLRTTFTGDAANSIIGSAASNLTLINTGALGTLYFDNTVPGTSNNIYTFFMSGSGGTATIGNPLNIGYLLSITGNTATTLNDGGNTITLQGNASATNGKHTGSGKLYMNGSLAQLQATVGGFGNVELDNVDGFSLSGTTIINGDLKFTSGTLSLLARTLSLKGTVSGMSAANCFVANGATSAITVNSASDVGPLFFDQSTPGTTDNLATFTVNSTGHTIELGSDMRVITTLALTAGELNDGGNIITCRGNITGTGTHSGLGKISITNTGRSIAGVTLGNLELNNASATTIAVGASPAIAGTLTFTLGTLTIGTSRTLNLNGTVAGMSAARYITGSTTSNLVVGATGALGDLYLNVSSAANRTLSNLSVTGGGSVNLKTAAILVNGLNLTDGTLDAGTNIITLQGDITGTGTHVSSGAGSITMTGASKTISGATVGNLILNNAAGFSLTGNANVTGDLTMTAGNLTLGANNLTLAAGTAINGTFSSSRMIITDGTGQVRKRFATTGSFTYPIGDNTPNYTPATVNLTGGFIGVSNYIAVNVANTKHPNNTNTSSYLNRYWSLTTADINTPVFDFTSTYLVGDVAGTEGSISMGEYSGASPWTKYGTVNTGSHTLTYTGIGSTSSDFTGITTAGPSVSVTPDNVTGACSGVDLTANGSGDPSFTYSWAPATRISATTGSTVTVYPTSQVIYTVTVTDGNGFTGTNTATVVGTVNNWVGGASGAANNWNTAGNWDCGAVPTASTDVIIPATSNAPVIPASVTASAYNLTVNSSVTVTLGASSVLNVKANLSNAGTITGPATSNITLTGISAQTLSGRGTYYNLELNNTGGATITNGGTDTVIIKGALKLTSGTLTTNNRLMLFANASGTGRIDQITGGGITGGVVTQVYVPSYSHASWHFWSHPFSDYIALNQIVGQIAITGSGGMTNGFTSAPTNTPSTHWIKQSAGAWVPFTNANANTSDNQFKKHQGIRMYIWGAPNQVWDGGVPQAVTIRMYGQVNTGNQDMVMTKASIDQNQLGNPYPAPVNIGQVMKDAFDAGKLAETSFYVWNPALGTTGQYVTVPIDGAAYYIPMGNGFQVRTALNGNTLNFTEAHKGTTANTTMRTYSDQVKLTVYDANYHPMDMVGVKFSEDAKEAGEMIDASKPEGPADFNFYSLSSDNLKLSVDVRPFVNGKAIPLGITTTLNKRFIIKISNVHVPEAGSALYLWDKYLQKQVLMNEDAEYSFDVNEDPQSQGDSRFELSMEKIKDLGTLQVAIQASVMPNPTMGDVKLEYTTNGVNSTVVSVINAAGETIITREGGVQKNGKMELALGRFPAGIYMVSVTSGTDKVVKTIVKQ